MFIALGNRRVKYIQPALNELGTNERPLSEFTDSSPYAFTDGQVARQAITILENHKRTRKPFWLAVGFNKPHVPFSAPKGYAELFQGTRFPTMGDSLPENVNADGPAHNKWGDVKSFPGLFGLDHTVDLVPENVKAEITLGYKSTTTFSDDMIGRVVRSLGCLADDTHIIVWGDQGWHLGEQGLWGKNTMFEAVLRSPLIIAPAGHTGGPLVQSTVVESIDILPTMMDLVGIETGSTLLDGRSLVPLLDGTQEERYAFSIGARTRYLAYSIRTSQYRYTEWVDLNVQPEMFKNLNFTALPDLRLTTLLDLGGETDHDLTELYDFADGQSETKNVAFEPNNVVVVAELAELLRDEVQ